MAPLRARRALMDDIIAAEILLRYRLFHRAAPPPLLAFLHDGDDDLFPHFVPTTAFLPHDPPHDGFLYALDCRHGRSLFLNLERSSRRHSLLVWDPVTRRRWELTDPCSVLSEPASGAVLCAAAGCDHTDCRGGPFLVVVVTTDLSDDGVTRAWVYSSETSRWTAPASIAVVDTYVRRQQQSVLVGGALYFLLVEGVLRYDMAAHLLSAIGLPRRCRSSWGAVLMATEDGSLGLAELTTGRNRSLRSGGGERGD